MCLALPGLITKVSGVEPLQRMGEVNIGGITRSVNLAYVPEAREGDYVIIHVGFAISVLSPDEAAETLECVGKITR